MSKQTSEKENATSSTSNKSKETHNKDSNLTERKKLDGTPFTIIKQYKDHDPLIDETRYIYFLVMGDHRLTEPQESEEELMLVLETSMWNIIFNVVAIVTEKLIKEHDKITEKPYDTESL